MIKSIWNILEKLEEQSTLEKLRKVNIAPEDRMLAITKETGELLNMILRLKNAKNMDGQQNNARTGQKTSLKMADMGLSTIIESKNKDSTGRTLSVENRRMFYRLRMWDRNSRSVVAKQSYIKAFTFLDGMRSKLGLPEHVVEKSAYLFRKVEQKELLHGRSNHSVLCAVVYIACRLTDTPRTLADIAGAAGIKKKVLQRVYRALYLHLDDVHSLSYSPCEFIGRISSEANISEKTRRDARKILESGQKSAVTSGKHPMSMAAAAVYMAVQDNHEKVSQTRIAQISGISAVTIRNRVKELQVLKENKSALEEFNFKSFIHTLNILSR